jgi:Cu-processing system permease protein
MKLTILLFKYELFNVLRGKWIFAYAVLFAMFSDGILQFGSDPMKSAASLMSIVLLIVPMVSTLYSTIYWYNSEGFTSLLLAQPVRRTRLYLCRWIAISSALSAGFVGGMSLPLILNDGFGGPVFLLLVLGVIMTFVFAALGMLTSVLISDRMKGIGIAFVVWFYFAFAHDSLVFCIQSAARDYPMEIPSMLLIGINPIGLARVTLLLRMNFAALMGYTGTVLQRVFSGPAAYSLTGSTLVLWMVIPVFLGIGLFRRKDF